MQRESINIFVANSAGSLSKQADMIRNAFHRASAHATRLINANGIDVVFVDAPGETIPEWGVGGYTWGPHTIIVALDPDFNVSSDKIEATLVHEFHHAMRWRGPGCRANLAEMLVSEGLAVLFEEEVLGEAPFYSRSAITEPEIAQAKAELLSPSASFNQAKWFFGAEGMTKAFGYTFGYQLCRTYAHINGKKASELVVVPTQEVLALQN